MSWIKMRTNLLTNPKVVTMSLRLKQPPYAVVGALFAVWAVADQHTEDGRLNMTPDVLDAVTGAPGISEAMLEVAWLCKDGATLAVPAFDTHNSSSAKSRAVEAVRSANRRGTGAPRSISGRSAVEIRSERGRSAVENRSVTGPREEKRREDTEQDSAPLASEAEQTPSKGEPDGFTRFWKAWPRNARKVDRIGCLRKWVAKGLEAIADRIIAAVEIAKTTADWRKDGGQWIPQPKTWLNQSRWEPLTPDAPGPAKAQAPAPALTPWQAFDKLPPLAKSAVHERVKARLAAGDRVQRIAADFDDQERRRNRHWTEQIARELAGGVA